MKISYFYRDFHFLGERNKPYFERFYLFGKNNKRKVEIVEKKIFNLSNLTFQNCESIT